ncbi:MAG TPA: acetyltransferase [Bacillus sp. (in: firmicutes)]|nr:acetyltransferase [Bacillus sp. (in: firmicutes)]
MEKIVRLASKKDLDSIFAFWQKVDIYVDGIEDYIDNFVLMEDDQQKLLATVGFQSIEENGLLRSLVITPSLRERDILVLFQAVMAVAEEKGMQHLYLVTNKMVSIPFFQLLNFQEIEYDELPAAIRGIHSIRVNECEPAVRVMEHTFAK